MAAALLLGGLSLAAAQPVPIPAAPPIHAAAEYTRPLRSVPGGNLSAVAIPGATPYKLVHLHGSTEERGFAYGRLLHADIRAHSSIPDKQMGSPCSTPGN